MHRVFISLLIRHLYYSLIIYKIYKFINKIFNALEIILKVMKKDNSKIQRKIFNFNNYNGNLNFAFTFLTIR